MACSWHGFIFLADKMAHGYFSRQNIAPVFPAKKLFLPGNDDTGGAAVVADREVPVVGHEGVLLAPEHDPHVRRVVFKQKRHYHQL
jgi:hypothetical protein